VTGDTCVPSLLLHALQVAVSRHVVVIAVFVQPIPVTDEGVVDVRCLQQQLADVKSQAVVAQKLRRLIAETVRAFGKDVVGKAANARTRSKKSARGARQRHHAAEFCSATLQGAPKISSFST
jgi:hypothetical protein